MGQNVFRCEKCGFLPRDSPVSGVWYCRKCGHKMRIANTRPRRTTTYSKKPKSVGTSRDQVYSQMYSKFTTDKPIDLGYKEPYLNPNINLILPKKRTKIRTFFKE